MKFNVGYTTQEGFVNSHFIIFENGLKLKTQSSLWLGKEGSEKLQKDFEEIVKALKLGELVYDETVGTENAR